MEAKENTILEFLALADINQSDISSVRSMILGISYSDKIWKTPNISDNSVVDNDLKFEVQIEKENLGTDDATVAFKVTINNKGNEDIHAFQNKLVQHIQEKLGFSKCSVLVHESSDKVAKTIQPLLLELEIGMRSALGNHFVKTNGINWWNEIASENLKQKIDKRSESLQLNNLMSANLTLTDSHDLGELLRATDFDSYTAEWDNAIDLKNKLEFQYPFTQKDLSDSKELTKRLKNIISDLKSGKAIATALTKEVPEIKQKEIKKSIEEEKEIPNPIVEAAKKEIETPKTKDDNFSFNIITEEQLLSELQSVPKLESGYVNLKDFVNNIIKPKGFVTGPTYSLAKNMDKKGLVELHEIKDEQGLIVQGIRIK
jgi:hypothetical protein